VGEILIRRDERNRVTDLVVRDVTIDTVAGTCALHQLKAVTTALVDYLHVTIESTGADEIDMEWAIDRCDAHLDRELDAVLETLVIGLKLLAEEFPADLVVAEATIGVEV